MDISIIKYESIWLLTILAVILLLGGIVTGFQYNTIEISQSTGNISFPILYLFPLMFFWLTLIVIGIREIKYRFYRQTPTIILMVNIILTISVTFISIYLLLISELIGEFFGSINQQETISEKVIGIIIRSWPFLVLLLLAFEIFLISRIMKINRNGRK